MKRIILVLMFFLIFTSFMSLDAQWARTYGGVSREIANSIQQTSDGGYIVAGETASFGAGFYDSWVLKLSSAGAVEWQKTYGGVSNDAANSIQQTSDGGYIVAGYTRSSGAGSRDSWVLKLYPDGDINSSCGFIGISDATVSYTFVSPQDTAITPQVTTVVPSPTSIIPIDTFITGDLLCEAPKYSLTISATTGGTTDPAPGTYTYYDATEAQIEAIPDTDYRFSEWTGDVPSGHENDNPITITMDEDKSIEANFIRQYTLTITAGSGGTTNPSPGSYTHDSGAQVSVTATANSGYTFSGWSGAASGTTNPVTITMDGNKSVTANFTATSTGGDDTEGGDKKCFIATAAYGSPLHPYVKTLRDFRDTHLMPSKLGQDMVNFYYKYSPFVANLIAKHKTLKGAVRINLLPLVIFSYSMLHFGLVFTTFMFLFIFLLPIPPILFCLRRLRRVEAKDPKALASRY